MQTRHSTSRITLVDAFRGFALAGIVFSHMVEQYIGARPPMELFKSFAPTTLDQVIGGLTQILITGKFFALFSFLFGVSFFMQMDSGEKRGTDFRGRFIWRLVLLFVIGYVHSLFYRGDILTIYAILGLVLVLFHRVRSTIIVVTVALIMLGTARYLVFGIFGNDLLLPYGDADPTLPTNVAYFEAILEGSFADVVASNAVYGHLIKMEFQLGYYGRWYLTLAFFLLGLLAGRYGLFSRASELSAQYKKGLWWSLGGVIFFFLTTGLLFSLGNEGGEQQPSTWLTMFALTSMDLFNFCLASLYLFGFILIYQRRGDTGALARLAPYGKTALSNYFLQSIIGTFLLYKWGLGLMGNITNTHTVAVAIAIVGLQLILSQWWLKYFKYGPLEWMWRSATYLQWQSLRK